MRPSKALIDLDALRHNLAVASRLAPGSKNIAVVKANASGHGMAEVARALQGPADALAVNKEGDANTLEVAGRVDAVVEQMRQNPRLQLVEDLTPKARARLERHLSA